MVFHHDWMGAARRFMQRSLMLLDNPTPPAPRYRTGWGALDAALDGGLRPGRLVLVQGPMAAGKTSLCLSLAARAQRRERLVAWLCLDRTFLPARARSHGLRPETRVAACDDAAEALAMAHTLVCRARVDLLVIDAWPPSLAAQPPAGALRELARDVAEVGTIVCVTQATLEASSSATIAPSAADAALRHSAATRLVMQPCPTRAARPRAFGGTHVMPTRVTVAKHVTRPVARHGSASELPTFIAPLSWDRGWLPVPASNSWHQF